MGVDCGGWGQMDWELKGDGINVDICTGIE